MPGFIRKHFHLTIGILLITISFLPWFFQVPINLGMSSFLGLLWTLGYLLVCNNIINLYSGYKYDPKIHIKNSHIWAIGLIAALLIEAIGNWSWKLWYYPLFSAYLYLLIMPFILVAYFYTILIGYLAARAFLLHFIHPPLPHKITLKRKSFSHIFWGMGILGTIGVIFALYVSLESLRYTTLADFLNSAAKQEFLIVSVVIFTVAFFMLLEFLEFEHREDSFLLHLLEGDWIPLVSVLLASLVTSFAMEVFNVPVKLWVYTNWPLMNITILGIPIIILLLWPIQYVLLVSIYRALYKKETERIWD